ncbi:MAG TPA: S8 family serine peptidase, partial [Chloroflexi bacterium]|nr:S8 family serine peptidase [Chloroflexota bacterium]
MKPQTPLYLFISILLLLLLSLALPAIAQQPDTPSVGSHFVRLPQNEAARIASLNLKPVHALDYGAFTWLEIDAAGLERLQAAGLDYAEEADAFTLRLGEESFDPLKESPALAAGWQASRSDGPDLRLVQLVGPTRVEWLDSLEQSGLEIVQYIHPYAYVVWGAPEALNRAAAGDFVRWSGDFAPAYRVQPRWRSLSTETCQARMMLYRGADVKAVLSQLEALGGQIEDYASTDPTFDTLRLTLPGNSFQAAAKIPGVYSLKLAPTDGGHRGEMSNQVNVNNVDGSKLAFTGYRDWLTAAGLDGSGVVMANVDGGIYNTHPDLINRMLPCSGTTCGGSAVDAHGTHTAGIMVADGASDILDSRDFLRGLGVAPGAQLIEQVYSPYFTWTDGLLLLIRDSYVNGAVLSGNSWGPSGSPQGYDDDTRQVDVGVRDASTTLPGNQAFSYILSFMNGEGGTSTQGSPDEAKNIFTIGSTKMQYSNGSQDLNINDISWNSAHGPALDGRTIPHMVAPGCYVDSTVSATGYGMMCGTSMASPQVSGAVGLFFEYYRQRFGSDPSPALVKAAFLPVAHDLAGNKDADGGALGHPFDSKQGWGRMNLAEVVSPTMDVLYFDNPLVFDNTGEAWEQTITVADPDKPFRAMLVWTDAPGHGNGGSTPAWVNDLDLLVEHSGNSYYGNNFNASGGWSQSGVAPDGMNNTEGVFIGPSASGSVTMRVVAANIAGDGIPGAGDATDQDFALVCYNCVLDADFTINAAPSQLDVCAPDDAVYTVSVGQILSYTASISLSVTGNPAGTSAVFANNPVANPTSTTLTIGNTGAVSAGNYLMDVVGSGPASVHTSAVRLDLFTAVPGGVGLTAPADNAINVSATPTFSWTAAAQAQSYFLEVASDSGFNSVVYTATVAGTSHTISGALNTGSVYYWRVRATNICGVGEYSAVYRFATA